MFTLKICLVEKQKLVTKRVTLCKGSVSAAAVFKAAIWCWLLQVIMAGLCS